MAAGVGKTDRQIMVELFANHLPSEAEIEHAFAVIDALTEEDMVEAPSTAVSGVDAALLALTDTGAGHSVLTGNSPRRAELKCSGGARPAHRLRFGVLRPHPLHTDGTGGRRRATAIAAGQRAAGDHR